MPQQNLVPFEFTPGIDKDKTPYEVGAGFIDGDKVRFLKGKPEKMGGWIKYSSEIVDGVARDILSWVTLDTTQYLSVATNERVEIFANNRLYDITPFETTLSATDAINVSAGSTFATIDFPLNGMAVGEIFAFTSSPTTVGDNVVLQGEYTVISASSNTIEIDTGIVAAATSTSAGGSFTGGAVLPSGPEYNDVSFGYGSGTYGSGPYGGGVSTSGDGLIVPMRQWTLDNFGEDLLLNPRGGRLYEWDATLGLGVRAAVITASPSVVNTFLVTPTTRQVMVFGCVNEAGVYDPLAYRWSDEEDYNGWSTSATSQAGEDRVDEGSQFMGAVASKGEIVACTDTAAYRIFNPASGIWGKQLLSKSSGLLSQHALVDIDGTAYWLGTPGPFMYNGVVQTMINGYNETLFNGVNSIAIDMSQKEMIFAGVNKVFHEIIWFYPSLGSTKCNRYLIYNYLENLWYDGNIDRSVWEDADVFDKPLAINRDSSIFQHETGYNDDTVPLSAWIETGIVDIQQGSQIAFIDKMIPDMELQGNAGHAVTIKTKVYPQSALTTNKTYSVFQNSGKVSVRARGREMGIIWTSNGIDTFFRFGKNRFSMTPDGER